MVWPALGINYKSSQANWDPDIAYLKKIGITTVRPNLSSFPNSPYTAGSEGNVVGSIEWWRQCAIKFKNEGFTVVYGITRATGVSGTFDATAWATYRANVLADAAYCQSIGLRLDYYQIGNEIEGIINNTTYTQTQLITDLKQLATDVKAVYPLANKIIYSTYDLSGTMFNNWISAGLGDIDVLAGNVYSQTGTNGRSFIFGDMTRLGIMLKTFTRDRFILSEFGIDGNAAQYALAPQYNRQYAMRHVYASLRELDFKLVIAYNYVGLLNADNDFALKNTDGTFDIQWDILVNDNGRLSNVNSGGQTVPISELRSVATGRQTATRVPRVESTRKVALRGRGNFAPHNLQPVNQAVLRPGAASDFSFVFKGILTPKSTPGGTSSHTLARCGFSFGNNLGYLFQVTNTTGRLRVLSGNQTYDSNAGVVPYNTEVTIAFTLTGTTLRGYVNGVLVTWFTSGTTSETIARKASEINNLDWFLAETGGAGAGTGGFQGEAYEVMSSLSLWSQATIVGIQNGIYPAADIRYNFTRGAGRWVRDLSGNDNDGLLGSEYWIVRG